MTTASSCTRARARTQIVQVFRSYLCHLACYVRSLSFLLIFMSIESIAFERCYNCFRDDTLHGTLLSHPHLTPTNLASQIAALRHLYVRCMQIFNWCVNVSSIVAFMYLGYFTCFNRIRNSKIMRKHSFFSLSLFLCTVHHMCAIQYTVYRRVGIA